MDTITWEQLQNIANNMLKATDNPDELLMLYLFKLHSLLLDTPVELHHHFAQSLINTGMFNDPVLKNLYGEFFNDEVSDLKQYDVLTHNMPQMVKAYGGHRRSKLNKRKNKSAGNPNEGESKALVPRKGSEAMVVANSSAQSAQDQPSRDLVHQQFKLNEDSILHVLQTNPDWQRLNEEKKLLPLELQAKKEELKAREKEQKDEKDKLLEERNNNIKKKFQSEVNKLYMQIGVDILFWLLGALIVYGLKSTPAWHYPGIAVDYVASWTIGEKIVWTAEYIIIAGVIGGIIKAGLESAAGIQDYSLAVSDIVAESTTTGKAKLAFKLHSGVHIFKLLSQRYQLPGEEDIFKVQEFKDLENQISKDKDAIGAKFLDLAVALEIEYSKKEQEKSDKMTQISRTEKIMTDKSGNITIFDDQSRPQLMSAKQPKLIDNRTVEEVFDEKKTNGGMKKQSKKYLKKIRKSRY